LYVNLGELKEKGSFKELSITYNPDNIDYFSREVKMPEDFELNLTIYRESEDYIFTGSIEGEFILECSRCLEKFPQKVRQELNFTISRQDIKDISKVNISSYLKEVLILAIPIKALCQEECQGFCSQCGINLNEESCNCSQEDVDPRMAKLQQFFEQE